MSDSFANLWSASTPNPQKPAVQRTLGGALAAQPPGAGARRPGPDAFSILASSKPNTASTPSTRSQTPSALLSSSTSAPVSKPPSRGPNDAFSGLLAGTGTFSGTGSDAGMSMAARAAKVEADRRAALAKQQAVSKQQSAAWAGLDALGSAPAAVSPLSASNDDDWLFGGAAAPASSKAPASRVTSPTAKPTKQADDWGLDGFISAPASTSSISSPAPARSNAQKTMSNNGGSFWDLDALDSAPQPARRETPTRSRTPGDFDFGDREDRTPEEGVGGEDDILGALAQPVSERRPSPHIPAALSSRSQGRSPPPHLVGQIVEMGYSLEQAKVALVATDSGEDVQAALEILLSGGTSEPAPAPAVRASRRREAEDDGWGDAPLRRFNYDDDEEDAPPRRAAPRRPAAAPEASAPARPNMSRTNSSTRERDGDDVPGIQTDKIIAQASEIGLSVFNRANALWKSGKEQAKKIYEEQQAARAASGSAPPRKDGRPKWMQDAQDEGGEPVAPTNGRRKAQQAQPFADHDGPAPAGPSAPAASAQPAAAPPTGDLFSPAPEEPAVRRPYRRQHSPPRTRIPAAAAPAPAARSSVRPAPFTLTTRQTVSATPAAIAAAEKHKAKGIDMFKLGRYAEAETSYSSAISALPDKHLLLIPLLNNRAAARFKIGDTAGAISDASSVVTLIGADYRPGTEKKVERKEEGADVDLGQALVKAWKRRAESLEGREKWTEALRDWERVAGCDFAGALKREGVTGAVRCRKATAPPTTSAPKPAPPKPKPKPAALSRPPARPAPPSEAVSRLKQANADAEAEDNAKHELKDAVEARIAAWKGGKETNIRALISSLENVLWPELGWVKVGMGDLLTPSQVKIRYTKAIAKLHPDKLNTKNTTVEQRMIANGVFSSLNDAWNAFQQSG